jgi:carboxylesterase type B
MGTSFEGILRANWCEDKAAKILQNPSYFAPLKELKLSPNDPRAIEMGTKIKKLFYKDGQEPSVENQLQYLNFISYHYFWHGILRLVLSRNAHASGKTFLFYFDVDGELNMFKKLVKKSGNLPGACHADDLFYLFNTEYHPPPLQSTPEFAIIQKLVGMFSSFATTGNPNCDEVGELTIKPCDGSEALMCIRLSLDDVVEAKLPEADQLKTWNSVYEEANVPLI